MQMNGRPTNNLVVGPEEGIARGDAPFLYCTKVHVRDSAAIPKLVHPSAPERI